MNYKSRVCTETNSAPNCHFFQQDRYNFINTVLLFGIHSSFKYYMQWISSPYKFSISLKSIHNEKINVYVYWYIVIDNYKGRLQRLLIILHKYPVLF